MRILIDDELLAICTEILRENRSDAEWALRESDDMFHRGPYVGGYDATESAFCFSRHGDDGSEAWFQLSLDQIEKIRGGELRAIEARPAE